MLLHIGVSKMLKRIVVNRTGNTLIKSLVVIAIWGILATIVGCDLFIPPKKRVEKAKKRVAALNIRVFRSALERYAADVGNYPTTEEGLQALFAKPETADGWDGPYVKKPRFLDPWKEPYIYRSPIDRPNYYYELMSKGPDREEGTEDDISEDVIN